MSELRVRIGPSVDRAAFDAAFASIGASAKRAFEMVSKQSAKAGADEIVTTKKTVAAKENTEQAWARKRMGIQLRSATMAHDLAAKEVASAERAERQKVQLAQRANREKAASDRQFMRENERMVREAERTQARAASAQIRQARQVAAAQKQAAASAHPRFGMSLGHGTSVAMSGIWGAGAMMGRMGLGIGADIAHAYGVNTSMGTAMERNADMSTLAMQITNEAHERGQTYANPEDLKDQAFDIGNKTGTGANKIMEGFQEFVGKTGDLSTASATMEQLSKIAKGTGSSLKDVVSAAAAVSNQLGDIPDKGRKVNEIMRALAGEAKLGAVPMRTMAAQAAKIVASAQTFEGDVGKNMATLGAIAQETALRGGVGSGAQAATAVQSLSAVFHTPASLASFKKAGININGAGGKIRNIEDIIVESLQKTQKGTRSDSNAALNKLFMGQRSGRAVAGFENVFRSTYSSTDGSNQEKLAAATEAVRKEFQRLEKAAMDAKEVEDSFNRAMKTGQSQSELWNNATQKAAAEMQKELLPAMIALTPKVVATTAELVKLIDFVMGVTHKPDPSALSNDMAAIHDLQKNHKPVPRELLEKALKDSQRLGGEATTAENEARGMKEHRTGNALLQAGNIAGKEHSGWDVTGLGAAYNFTKALVSGRAGKDADTEQSKAAGSAQSSGDQATAAYHELIDELRKNTAAVQDDTNKTAHGGAASPSTNTLSPNPSGH